MNRSCKRLVTINEPGDPELATQQHHKDACNVNNIVRRFQAGGVIETNTQIPRYEYASSKTYCEAMREVTEAQSNFENLPGRIKRHFHNNIEMFLDALSDPEQRQALLDLGLIPKTPEIDPQTQERLDTTPPISEEIPPPVHDPLE